MPSFISDLDVPAILKLSGGLNFLLALLAFWLIYREQGRRSPPRPKILHAIYCFIAANFLSLILALGGSYLAQRDRTTSHAALQSEKAAIQTELDDATTQIQRYQIAAASLRSTASGIQHLLNVKLALVVNNQEDPTEATNLKTAIQEIKATVAELPTE